MTTETTLAETLERLALVGPEVLDEVRDSDGLPDGEVLDALVEAGHLTAFQAEKVAGGRGTDLVVSHYLLIEPLGPGALGTVYRARSRADGAPYAVRLVPRRSVINLAELSAKVEALKQVRHPRVSAMVHVGTGREWAFAAYPYLEGGEKLDVLVQRHRRLPPRLTVQIGLQIASGLQAHHQHGLFHGLLKPNEVVIGADRRVRLLDFGVGFLLACERGKALLDTTTNTKALARGLDCASPESIMDPLDRTPAGDQYSLGCILYFCLTGQFPFPDGNPVKKMLGHQFHEPTAIRELAPEVPARLEAVVWRMLAKKPEDRYAGIEEVAEELKALSADPRALPAAVARPAPTLVQAPPVVPSARLEEGAAGPEGGEPAGGGAPWWLPWAVIGVSAGAFGVATAAVFWLMRRG